MSSPYSVQRPVAWYGSAGRSAGKCASWAPAASISSRTIASTRALTLSPRGSQAKIPGAWRRMYPARTSSLWLRNSASAGSSRRVRRNRRLIRVTTADESTERALRASGEPAVGSVPLVDPAELVAQVLAGSRCRVHAEDDHAAAVPRVEVDHRLREVVEGVEPGHEHADVPRRDELRDVPKLHRRLPV